MTKIQTEEIEIIQTETTHSENLTANEATPKKTRTTRKKAVSTETKSKRAPRRKKNEALPVEDTNPEDTNLPVEVIVDKKSTNQDQKASVELKTDATNPTIEVVEQKPAAETQKKNNSTKAKKTEEKIETRIETKEEQKDSPKTEHSKKIQEIPPCPTLLIKDIVDLVNAPHRQLLLTDQQIQQLTIEEAERRFRWIEGTLALVLDYDIVLSDTNIWLELLVGHTSSHSDPRVNARLQFERQLEFISRLSKHRRGRFMMMSETYEEIDRFATLQDPTNYKDADFTDEATCRNIAGRLAKRLILSQQRENRLRIEGIGSESHHSAFADPAIIRRTVELFATGKKVLLLTNDASVAIRAMGMCDDLQRTNGVSDEEWNDVFAPIRPMVFTMDDLKILDQYTRQYHFLQMAAGKQWMEDVPQEMQKHIVEPLNLWMDGFRPGDRYSEKKKQQNSQNQSRHEQRAKVNQQKTEQQKPQAVQQKPQQEEQEQKPQQEQQKQPEQSKQKRNKQQKKQQQKQDQKSDAELPAVENMTSQAETTQPSTSEATTTEHPTDNTPEESAAPQKPKRRGRRR